MWLLWDPHFTNWKLGTEKVSSICEITQQSWDSNPAPILSTRSPHCFSKVRSNTVTNPLSYPSGPLTSQRMKPKAASVSQSALPRPLEAKGGRRSRYLDLQNMIQKLYFNKHPQKIIEYINVWELLKKWNKEKAQHYGKPGKAWERSEDIGNPGQSDDPGVPAREELGGWGVRITLNVEGWLQEASCILWGHTPFPGGNGYLLSQGRHFLWVRMGSMGATRESKQSMVQESLCDSEWAGLHKQNGLCCEVKERGVMAGELNEEPRYRSPGLIQSLITAPWGSVS